MVPVINLYLLHSVGARSRHKDQCVFLLYISTNAIVSAKGCHGDSASRQAGLAMDFTRKDLYAINEIHSEPNLFRLLVGYCFRTANFSQSYRDSDILCYGILLLV